MSTALSAKHEDQTSTFPVMSGLTVGWWHK